MSCCAVYAARETAGSTFVSQGPKRSASCSSPGANLTSRPRSQRVRLSSRGALLEFGVSRLGRNGQIPSFTRCHRESFCRAGRRVWVPWSLPLRRDRGKYRRMIDGFVPIVRRLCLLRPCRCCHPCQAERQGESTPKYRARMTYHP